MISFIRTTASLLTCRHSNRSIDRYHACFSIRRPCITPPCLSLKALSPTRQYIKIRNLLHCLTGRCISQFQSQCTRFLPTHRDGTITTYDSNDCMSRSSTQIDNIFIYRSNKTTRFNRFLRFWERKTEKWESGDPCGQGYIQVLYLLFFVP